MNFSSRLVFVTGAGSGIGATVAAAFGMAGATVVAADVDLDNAGATAAQVQASGASALAVRVDVSDPLSVDAAFSAAEQRFQQHVDVLVNSAGIMGIHALLDFPVDLWTKVMAVNVTGTFLCARRAAPAMIGRGYGRIVNLASISAERAGIGRTAYGTSKAAVAGLTRQLALELGPSGVTANAVAPGPVLTAMTQASYTPATIEQYSAMIPAHRLGTAQEMADAILFLASESAGYINGVMLPVDGGYLASGIAKTGSLGN